MPLENLEEEGLEKNPNLELAQMKFLLSLFEHKDETFLKTKLLDAIKADSEIAFFLVCCIISIFEDFIQFKTVCVHVLRSQHRIQFIICLNTSLLSLLKHNLRITVIVIRAPVY